MPRRVSFIPSAQRQFNAQVAYLSDRNPAAAYRLLARVEAARQQLSDFPRSGSRGPVPSTRRLIVSPYVLTYREVDGDIEIIDFRHGRQRGLGEEDQTSLRQKRVGTGAMP